MQMYVLQENLIFMAGLIAIAKSFGNLKKGRIKKKKREMVKKAVPEYRVMTLKDRFPNLFLFFFNKEGMYTYMYIYHVCKEL